MGAIDFIQTGLAAAAIVWATAAGATEGSLATPTGPVVLTVSGDIEVTNVDGTAQFDLAGLQALDATSFTTATPWTEGPHTFTGVLLKALVDLLQIEDGTLSATAINDYAIDIPVAEALEDGPIVAYAMDGAPMSVRDKGPLWIVYPFDADPDYRSELTYSRSIWQLDRIVVTR